MSTSAQLEAVQRRRKLRSNCTTAPLDKRTKYYKHSYIRKFWLILSEKFHQHQQFQMKLVYFSSISGEISESC